MGGDAAGAGGRRLTRLPPSLVETYRAARYGARIGHRTIRLRVEHPVPEPLARWIGKSPAAMLITACAPLGLPHLHPGAGRAAQRRLRRHVLARGRRFLAAEGNDEVIPTPTDQNPCAQSRMPMDMMRQGWATRRFQWWQQ